MRLSTRRLVSFAVCLGFSSLLAGAVFAQPDPQVGLWKLNVAKSKYAPGPAPKSGPTRIEAAGAGTKAVVDQGTGEGTGRPGKNTAKNDGKDTRGRGNNPNPK